MLAAAHTHHIAGPPPVARLRRFTGSSDTLEQMRRHVWGERGEKSPIVRQMTEEVVAGIWPKDYLSEIIAIRNFNASHLRYTNDPLHVEYIKDPERLVTEIRLQGHALADCDEIAELIATMALQIGRVAEFVVVGFGAPGEYSHVFARVKEPKSGRMIVCDPVAGTDERTMLSRVTTFEIWSLDE
jgi:hypothetical protein